MLAHLVQAGAAPGAELSKGSLLELSAFPEEIRTQDMLLVCMGCVHMCALCLRVCPAPHVLLCFGQGPCWAPGSVSVCPLPRRGGASFEASLAGQGFVTGFAFVSSSCRSCHGAGGTAPHGYCPAGGTSPGS